MKLNLKLVALVAGLLVPMAMIEGTQKKSKKTHHRKGKKRKQTSQS